MKAVTHLTFAGMVGVVSAGLGAEVGVAEGAALAAGALLPDIDTTTSGLGRWVKPISGLIERKFGHRTLTHSLLGLGLLALLTCWLLLVNPAAWLWLLVGAATHILLDAHNVTGVPLLYPFRLDFVTVTNRSLRTPYGSPQEFGYLGGFALIAVALVPFAHDGFSPWFHRALGAPYGAVEDYLDWRDEAEVWVDIEGFNLLTDEDVKGRFRAIDALGRDTLLVEDGAGRAYSAALNDANIQVRRIRAWKGESLVASTYRLDLSGRLVSDLLHSLPKGAKAVHINAALELNDFATAVPAVGYFQRVEAFGKKIEARSATVGDLSPLSGYVIEHGSAVIRVAYAPGSEALADLSVVSSTPQVKSHILKIPSLPAVSGLVVEVGQELVEGELVARYVDDSELELNEAEAEAARLRVPELEARIAAEREAHKAKLSTLDQAKEDTETKLEQVRYLVERGAEPKNSLVEAEAALRRAEGAVLKETTDWTSELTRLEAELRGARLTITKAEGRTKAALEKQWVRAPVGGLVSDIRIAEVTTKGVTLEVMILERDEDVLAATGDVMASSR